MTFRILSNKFKNLGSEIVGLDPLNISSEDFNILLKEIYQTHLLIIRNLDLNEEKLIAIAKLFGELTPSLLPTFRLEKYPVISCFSNIRGESKEQKGAMAPEYVFHSDSYFTQNPNKYTLLYSLKSPEYGGETCFIDMCYAYDSLDNETKEFILDKYVIYKNAYINQPPLHYPMVRSHPITGRKALFVNVYRALGIVGLPDEQALPLIERLYKHALREDLIYKHKWQDGDLLIWYNPTTMHCATHIVNSQERLLHRILIKGDLPVT